MPLRKRIGIMGLVVGVPCGARTRLFALCYATCCPCTISTISRFHGLSVVTRGEFTQRFRLSQAYVYIIPRFSAPKLAKFQNKKVGRSHDQLSNLCSHLLRACDTHEPALARKLRRHVAELLPYAIHRALVHRTIHTRLYRIMTAIVVAHRPALCRRALSVQVLHNLKPALRQAHRPAAVKRDCLQLRRESDSLLRGRITDVRMSRAAAVSAGLHPRFFDSSLNATLIA